MPRHSGTRAACTVLRAGFCALHPPKEQLEAVWDLILGGLVSVGEGCTSTAGGQLPSDVTFVAEAIG